MISGCWTLIEERVRSELVDGVLRILENRLEKIILYGSVARGTDTEEQDIDIALVMHGKIDSDTEGRLSDFVVDMNLKYDKVFSVIDIDADYKDFEIISKDIAKEQIESAEKIMDMIKSCLGEKWKL